ncbi:hypothetical protein SAMN02746064_00828 [Alkalibacter saccharofermentans DSM 14828]|uniref:Uncharacterized protein n=1 Tax=Alkalibacter saccharofermentans DSM 14828 TaxID=1120975 RepID=A0A1M4UU71_9FIRM|nr:hypothetical protein SAMN02746064_00828 [Alkalibacter saccharofermentans DSM 14828]
MMQIMNNIFIWEGEVTMNKGLGIIGTIVVILIILWLLKII